MSTTINCNIPQPNMQNLFQATSPLRAAPITAAEEISVFAAMQAAAPGIGFTWDSSRVSSGLCVSCQFGSHCGSCPCCR